MVTRRRQESSFKPGFRLSAADAVVLAAGLLAAASVCRITVLASGIFLFVLTNFFIFCNVIRMSRPPELIWAAAFLLLSGSALLAGMPSWLTVFAAASALTVVLVCFEMRKPSYHGAFWQSVNPELPRWFEKNKRRTQKAA